MKIQETNSPFIAVTCEIAGTLIGVDSTRVEEIVLIPHITPVPGAATWVRGIVNLRGRIVTVVDLGHKMALGETQSSADARIIIARLEGESVGLIVPKLSDVVEVDPRALKTVGGESKNTSEEHYLGLFEHGDQLLALLDLDKALQAP